MLLFDPLAEGEVGGQESEADIESLPGAASEVETVEVPEYTVDSDPIPMERRLRAVPGAFASLDAVDLHEVFELRARVMRSVPAVLRGAFRASIRVSMQEILNGVEAHSEVRAERGWKLFLLLPRMLLFRPARGGVVPRKKLEGRIRQFQEGDWISLLNNSANCAAQAKVAGPGGGTVQTKPRAARAMSLVQVGELSAARQALEGAALAGKPRHSEVDRSSEETAFPTGRVEC